MQGTYDSDKRKLLSCLSHGAIFFSTTILSVGVPITITLISDDPVVKANAKESINFHFNVWFWAVVLGVIVFLPSLITFGLFGTIVFGIGFALHWGLTAWALLHCFGKPDEPFRYPFIFRLI
ncbi:DUF4870 domain-containing protein [Phormidesmis priestleyi]